MDEVLERFGRVDVLVNNAGYGQVGAVEETTEEGLRAIFDVYTSSGRPRWSAPFCRRCAVGGPAL